MIAARPYQAECISKTLKGFEEFNRQLAVLPTGSGKTVIFSMLAARFQPKRTLILAHREELIDQAIAKLHATTGIFAQKEKAEFKSSLSAPVVVASVQSMINRLHRWNPDHFGLIVADEAHHAISASWQRVLRHFSGKQMGVTATPDRGDNRNLGSYFEHIPFEISLFDLIHQGYLSKIVVQSVPLKIDLNKVRQTAGDFNETDLSDALAPYLKSIAEAIRDLASFRRVLVFVPLIATSKKFVEVCKTVGLSACHIDGESPDRKEILARYANGEFDVLSNAMLLTEGFDDPGIDCVCVLRPTRSRSLYSQMVGRGTRVNFGKSNLLLLDFLWMHEKHNLIRPAHLVAQTQEAAEEMQALQESKYGQEILDLEDLATETQVSREEKLRAELEKKSKKKGRVLDADAFCSFAHEFKDADYQPVMPSEMRPMLKGQVEIMDKYAIDVDSIKGRDHADKVIHLIQDRMQKGLATPKQLRCLIQFKHPSPHTATLEQATAFLDRKFSVGKEVSKYPRKTYCA